MAYETALSKDFLSSQGFTLWRLLLTSVNTDHAPNRVVEYIRECFVFMGIKEINHFQFSAINPYSKFSVDGRASMNLDLQLAK